MRIKIFGAEVSKSKTLKNRVRKFVDNEKLDKDCNIIFSDRNYMHKLNLQFLNRDYATDVLSFDLGDCCEIYILENEAKSLDDSWKLILHGLLHLKGYDHETDKEEKKMRRAAEKYFNK